MKTNLIFKRQETIDGETKVVTKIIPVEVPFINSGEGWVLSGHTDIIEVMNTTEFITSTITEQSSGTIYIEKPVDDITVADDDETKFISDVKGTAKLVRAKGVIKIVARRGKSTYNQTTPNSVCISDITKNNFFRNCREVHGDSAGIFQLTVHQGRVYDYWNDIIDKEYQRQKTAYLNKYK